MEITVVDAMMGRGKTSAAIRHMKENQDKRFLFITPYITEVARICGELGFEAPSDHGGSQSKSKDLMALMYRGANIASTHALWSIMCDEALSLAKEKGYHLIVDESPNVIEYTDMCCDDIDILIRAGAISVDDKTGKITWVEDGYNGLFRDFQRKAEDGRLYLLGKEVVELFDPKMLLSFKSVTIMTYMFEHQLMRCYCNLFDIEYNVVGVVQDDVGYQFSDRKDEPDKTNFRSLVKIIGVDTPKVDGRLNEIGDSRTALSVNWYHRRGKNGADVSKLRRNLHNFFCRKCRVQKGQRLWTTYAEYSKWLFGQDNRYSDSFLSCTARATNAFKEATAVAYLVNRYINPNLQGFLYKRGIKLDGDMFALSEMLQWIWRSAIRDGKEITLYIPSKRMRNLLIRWLNDVSGITEEDDIEEEFEFDETMEDGGEVA